MKKTLFAAFAVLAMLAAVSCSKSESGSDPVSDGPVCKTLELHIEYVMSKDITDNFNVVAKMTDFDGKVVTQALDDNIGGSTVFTNPNANINSDKSKCPFKLQVDLVEKEGRTPKESYEPKFELYVYAVFKDADGKELYTGDSKDGRKSYVMFKNYSKESAMTGFDKFKSNLERHLKVSEITYVFFRGQSIVSGEYFFAGEEQ